MREWCVVKWVWVNIKPPGIGTPTFPLPGQLILGLPDFLAQGQRSPAAKKLRPPSHAQKESPGCACVSCKDRGGSVQIFASLWLEDPPFQNFKKKGQKETDHL